MAEREEESCSLVGGWRATRQGRMTDDVDSDRDTAHELLLALQNGTVQLQPQEKHQNTQIAKNR